VAIIIDFFSEHQSILWLITVFADLGLTVLVFRLFGKIGLYNVVIFNIMLSNLQGPKLTVIFGLQTSLGLILYSGIYFATDVLSEKYGRKESNRAVLLGFATSAIIVIMMSLGLLFLPSTLPPDSESAKATHEALAMLYNYTPRFVFGSLFVYLVSQSFDVWLFHYIKHKTKGKHLWLRNNVSTICSQTLDTVLYSLIVWWSMFDFQTVVQLAGAKYIFKVIIALLDTPFIYWVQNWDMKDKDWNDFESTEKIMDSQKNLQCTNK
jgi:uncharacterized integral membrane protein (TIGR00697 family)